MTVAMTVVMRRILKQKNSIVSRGEVTRSDKSFIEYTIDAGNSMASSQTLNQLAGNKEREAQDEESA
jgi:hypothetical protein